MAIGEDKSEVPDSDDNRWGPCTMPFWQTSGNGNGNGNGNGVASGGGSSSSQTSSRHVGVYGKYMMDEMNSNQQQQHSTSSTGGTSVSSVAKSLLPAKKRLQLDPAKKLYFPYEPGKQVRSAIRLKNTSKSHAAFKFQTTAPKSCFMRPPGGILAPGESVIATVFKFVEPPEENENFLPDKCNVKFKIMSLKVKPPIEYVPELFDEQKDKVSVERILRVVFLDVENPSPQMEKLKNQLEEADSALEARRRPPEDTGPQIAGEGLVIDEWRERRERYLAQQQVEGVDSA